MLQSFDLSKLSFLLGDENFFGLDSTVPTKHPFDESIISFLGDLSKAMMSSSEVREYSEIVTFAFWIRKASLEKLKQRFYKAGGAYRCGRGIVFHIAPSNVPVNFAYSLVAGLLAGNRNIVRVSSKKFPQVDIIVKYIKATLMKHDEVKSYICVVRYSHDREVNDFFSLICDTRVIWGGNSTIAELRQSRLMPRSTEITFADRFSLAVINSDIYLSSEKKERIAEDFYNDTYHSDQNACTSPNIVIWTGTNKEKAKKKFWKLLHEIVREKYSLQAIQAVSKLTSACISAIRLHGSKIIHENDNLIYRIVLTQLSASIIDLKDNSGFFFEYDCDNILDLRFLCNDSRCQTIGYLGNKENFYPLLLSGVAGIDRIIPIGRTMDFDLMWDGYDLISHLSRVVDIQ